MVALILLFCVQMGSADAVFLLSEAVGVSRVSDELVNAAPSCSAILLLLLLLLP